MTEFLFTIELDQATNRPTRPNSDQNYQDLGMDKDMDKLADT